VKILLRLAFSLLIIIGVAAQFAWLRAAHAPADDDGVVLSATAGLGLRVVPVSQVLIQAFAPGCADPARIALVGLDATRLLHASNDAAAGSDGLYVFMGKTAARPAFARFYIMRVLADAQAVFGLRSTRAPSHVVHITLPQSCPKLAKLAWVELSPGSGARSD